MALGLLAPALLARQGHAQVPQPPRAVNEAGLQAVIAGRQVALVVVKDFMRFQSDSARPGLEFERYIPVIDSEQVVLGRWVRAVSDARASHPVAVVSSTEDSAGNLIQKYRVGEIVARSPVLVVTTTLVARREPARPQGKFAIPRPDEYPPQVRPYLRSSTMVVTDHQLVEQEAQELLEASGGDALKIAVLMARRADTRPYLPTDTSESDGLPASAFVLKYGGSCCVSATSACAVLRACGIPAQVTYCPAGFIHGITRFYLQGHGWVRVDTTSGSGRYPLVQEAGDLGMVRVYDLPAEMEYATNNYAWPYQYQNLQGRQLFSLHGAPLPDVRQSRAEVPDGELPYVQEPFRHLEPGSWNMVLGSAAFAGRWQEWKRLVERSREAVGQKRMGVFLQVIEDLGVEDFAREAERAVGQAGAAVRSSRAY